MFVVHSMGGLVVKKALTLGYNDPQYQQILNTVCGIVFLATPHRGSGLAGILNKFLRVTFQSTKKYVSDLQRNSSGIEDINDQFRHHAPRLQIVSFFETLPSHFGMTKIIVVERDSAILGYSNEISAPLNADHHTVCKYASRHDPNYVTVRNVIRSMVEKFGLKSLVKTKRKDSSSTHSQSSLRGALESVLGIIEVGTDLNSFLDRYFRGSGDWILDDPDFKHWLRFDSSGAAVLHITGNPGSGKSVIASFLIEYLEESGCSTQHFFFKFDDWQTKNSIRHCLLSLAYQMALSFPEYGQRLVQLLEDRNSIAKADIRRLWQKMFLGLFMKLKNPLRTIWVIDAIDESESVERLLSLLPSLEEGGCSIRIIFLTRPHTVSSRFDRLKDSLPSSSFFVVPVSTPESCLSLYIAAELRYTKWPGDPDFMDYITKSLLIKCRGNFLWLRLVLNELANCDFPHEALQALEETPEELAAVYHRIQGLLVHGMRPENRQLAIRILSWITSSERQLSLEELSEALQTQQHSVPMLHLRQTIDRLCGDLVTVDTNNIVSMVHHTAKEFLTHTTDIDLHVDSTEAHTMLFSRCLEALADPKFRLRLKTDECDGFLQYACTSWSYHLSRSNERQNASLVSLAAFLRSHAVLCWINAVCKLTNLRILTTSAKNMNTFRHKRRKFDAEQSHTLHPVADIDTLALWAAELIKIVGKFGFHLLRHPTAIYNLVPPFCPPDSAVSQQFYDANQSTLSVSGLLSTGWDDSLASFSVGHDCQPTVVHCMETHFAIHTRADTVNLFDASVFQETRKYCHQEFIVALNFNQDGDRLVTCGPRTVKIWDVSSGRLLYIYANPSDTRAYAVAFTRDSAHVVMCCMDGRVRLQNLGSPEDWKTAHREIPLDGFLGHGSGPPCAVSFCPDGSKVAIAKKGMRFGLWNTESGKLIGICQRSKEGALSGMGLRPVRPYPITLTWNPIHEHVVGVYNDLKLFKWNPVDTLSEELEQPVPAYAVVCSPDGRFVVTACGDGSLHVWRYDTFSFICYLSCTSPVTSISVSPDGRRIYDTRESFCNVWEPNSLIRLAEADEQASETSSSHAESTAYSLQSELSAAIKEPVTSLEAASQGTAYCYSDDNGKLTFRSSTYESPRVVDCGFFGAKKLAFSNDEELIACAEFQGSVFVRRTTATDDYTELSVALELTSENPVQQILFDLSDSVLVIRCTDWIKAFPLRGEGVPAVRPLGIEHCCLALHPQEHNTLLSISSTGVTALSSWDLALLKSWRFDVTAVDKAGRGVAPTLSRRHSYLPASPGSEATVIDKVLSCPNKRRILVQSTEDLGPGRRSIRFFMFDPSLIRSNKESAASSVEAEPLPLTVLRRIEIPIGFVSDDAATGFVRRGSQEKFSLAFLDHDFWVCTWSMDDLDGSRIRKHFFLPRDWINMDCLELAVMTPDGRFFCPRNGEVAVVSGGLRDPWLD
ncbi:hypothetical protein BJ170DRAFT_118323 [Xylariales sp. AK1849]|nr:hypothetical protein BJ170DRAFT_118323 [Xylariales sp. AK1849]